MIAGQEDKTNCGRRTGRHCLVHFSLSRIVEWAQSCCELNGTSHNSPAPVARSLVPCLFNWILSFEKRPFKTRFFCLLPRSSLPMSGEFEPALNTPYISGAREYSFNRRTLGTFGCDGLLKLFCFFRYQIPENQTGFPPERFPCSRSHRLAFVFSSCKLYQPSKATRISSNYEMCNKAF